MWMDGGRFIPRLFSKASCVIKLNKGVKLSDFFTVNELVLDLWFMILSQCVFNYHSKGSIELFATLHASDWVSFKMDTWVRSLQSPKVSDGVLLPIELCRHAASPHGDIIQRIHLLRYFNYLIFRWKTLSVKRKDWMLRLTTKAVAKLPVLCTSHKSKFLIAT